MQTTYGITKINLVRIHSVFLFPGTSTEDQKEVSTSYFRTSLLTLNMLFALNKAQDNFVITIKILEMAPSRGSLPLLLR